jgi:hypothetical protein
LARNTPAPGTQDFLVPARGWAKNEGRATIDKTPSWSHTAAYRDWRKNGNVDASTFDIGGAMIAMRAHVGLAQSRAQKTPTILAKKRSSQESAGTPARAIAKQEKGARGHSSCSGQKKA